jgi:hypothetical protein
MQAVCNHTPNMQQNMAYDNFNRMLLQAILSRYLKGTKTINSLSHFFLADNLRGEVPVLLCGFL